MKHATLKTLSAELNLSAMTVSKALRNHPDISDKTRKLVQELAKRRNYSPNLLASALSRKRTKAIGFLFPDLRHDFAHMIIQGAKSVLLENDYLPIIGLTSWDSVHEQREVNLMIGQQVEGIICLPTPCTENVYQRVADSGTSLVFVGSRLEVEKASYVSLNGRKAVQDILDYLMAQGHRRIAFLAPGSVDSSPSLKVRLQAYRETMAANSSLGCSEQISIAQLGNEKSVWECVDKLIDSDERPTAIMAINDMIAYNVMHRLMQRKIRIPEDIAVTGIGGSSVSALEMVSLTTVEESPEIMGKAAAEIMLGHLSGKIEGPMQKLYDGRLEVRRSTRTSELGK